jgi:mono/diheme cytochrome c family protein
VAGAVQKALERVEENRTMHVQTVAADDRRESARLSAPSRDTNRHRAFSGVVSSSNPPDAHPFRFSFFAAASLATCFIMTGAAGAAESHYTQAQAAEGKTVYAQQCAICHGDQLQGKVGPALAGSQFLSVSQFQELTADYLYQFMAKHMPANAPGSLSQTQYVDLMAYILEVNGYPAGSRQLTADDHELTQIKIEPTGEPQHKSETEDPK